MTLQQPYEAPTRLYDPTPTVVGPGQVLMPAQGYQSPTIVINQAAPLPKSWLSEHSGQIIAGLGAGGLVVAALLAVAIVAVAVGIGAISCAIGWLVIRSLMGTEKQK
jgi:hypothetical protein